MTDDGGKRAGIERVRRQPAKPTGILGPVRVGRDETGEITGGFEQINYPRNKDGIETFIAERFVASLNKGPSDSKMRPFFSSLAKNAEDDYDFSIRQAGRPGYLELTEIVSTSRRISRAGYPDSISYNEYEFAEEILSNILGKSRHYGKTKDRIFLLAYATHWSFVPSEGTVMCLRAMLHRAKPNFSAVFCFSLLDEIEGTARFLYPVPPEMRPREALWDLRNSVVLNLDPRKMQLLTSESTTDVSARISPGDLKLLEPET